MNTRIVMGAFSIMSSLALMSGAAFAAFSSSVTNAGNTFGAGTLTLNLQDHLGSTLSTPAFTVTGIAPGDTKFQLIKLANTGSVDAASTLLTSITHSTSDSFHDLGDKLNLSVYKDPTDDDTIAGNVVTDPGSDDVLQGGPTALTSGAWSNIALGFGIPHATSHQLVLKVQLDPTTDNTFQGKDSTFSLNFQANQ